MSIRGGMDLRQKINHINVTYENFTNDYINLIIVGVNNDKRETMRTRKNDKNRRREKDGKHQN